MISIKFSTLLATVILLVGVGVTAWFLLSNGDSSTINGVNITTNLVYIFIAFLLMGAGIVAFRFHNRGESASGSALETKIAVDRAKLNWEAEGRLARMIEAYNSGEQAIITRTSDQLISF